MKYTTVIVDDNILERDDLELQLRKMHQLDIVGTCSNGLEAYELFTKMPVDILFTDIDMPLLSGTALIKALQNPPVVICITAFPQYALEGYELNVIDFISKPVPFERLLQSVTKATEYLRLKALDIARQSAAVEDPREGYFFIREATSLTRLQYSEVAYIESKGDFSKVFTLPGKSHMTLVSLKSLENSLPDHSFLRVHKQYIINRNFITSIGNEELTIDYRFRIPLSATHRQALLDKVVDNKLISRKNL